MTGPAFEALVEATDHYKDGCNAYADPTVVTRWILANMPLVLAAGVEEHGISEIMRMLTEGGWVEERPLKTWNPDRSWRLAPVAEEEGT